MYPVSRMSANDAILRSRGKLSVQTGASSHSDMADEQEHEHDHVLAPASACCKCDRVTGYGIAIIVILFFILVGQVVNYWIWSSVLLTITPVATQAHKMMDDAQADIFDPIHANGKAWFRTINQTMITVSSFTDSGPTNLKHQVFNSVKNMNEISTMFNEELPGWRDQFQTLLDALNQITPADMYDFKTHADTILHQIEAGNATRLIKNANQVLKIIMSASSGIAQGLIREIPND